MNQILCDIHTNQYISAICTRKECDQPSAICQRCMLEFHRLCPDHIKFLDDIPKEIAKIENEVGKINQIFKSLIQLLKELKKQYKLHFKQIYECQAILNIKNLNNLGSIFRNKQIDQDRLQTGKLIINQSIEAYLKPFQNKELSDQQKIEAQEWREKGRIHFNSNDFYKAIECYDRALCIDPYSETYWRVKGNALQELSKFKDSIICYDEALKINPNNDELWNKKGLSLQLNQFPILYKENEKILGCHSVLQQCTENQLKQYECIEQQRYQFKILYRNGFIQFKQLLRIYSML